MNKNDDSPGGCSDVPRDRRNRRRVTVWALAWALTFIVVTLGIKKLEWSSGVTLGGAVGTAIFGLATVLAYRKFLLETDELRRKIEVEALALAFGVGVFGGLSLWLLAVSGAVDVKDFAFLFAAMIFTHSVGVLLGIRRYS